MGKDEPEDQEEPPNNAAEEETSEGLEPVEEKIPERPENLRRREDWFRKRSGGS